MRKGILAVLLVVALGVGGWSLWRSAKEKAALKKEAEFSEPFNKALEEFQQKKYIDAEAILTGLLSTTERESPDSLNLASVLHGLGAVIHLQKRDSEAEPYYLRAVEIRKRLMKPDDPELVSSLNGLALTLKEQGKTVEEDKCNREIIAICRLHPELYRGAYAMNLLNVGYFDFRRLRFEEAQSLFVESVAAFEKYEGSSSPNLALAATGLGEVYEAEGKYGEAEPLYRKALAIQEAHSGPNDADMGRTLEGLANIRYIRGDTVEAAALRKRSAEIFANARPTISESEAVLLNRRAEVQARLGNYKSAVSLYKQAVAAEEEKYGPDHPRVADELDALARLYRDVPSFDISPAEAIFERILAIRQKNFGPDSAETAATESDLALLYFYEKKYDECKQFASRALPVQEKAFGPQGILVSSTLNRLGLCQRDTGELDKAKASLSRALEIRTKLLNPDHPWIVVSVQNLATVYLKDGEPEKARLLMDTIPKH